MMTSPNKIVFVMASNERVNIVKQNVNHLTKYGDVVLVVSKEEEYAYFKIATNANVFIHANEPLGAKWQRALDIAKGFNPDIVIPMGSDDFISEDYISCVKKLLSKGFDFLGINGWFLSDGKEHYKAKYAKRNDFPAGSGRVFTKKCLDRINWQLYDTKLNRLLDDKALNEIKKARLKTYISPDPDKDGLKILALKGNWNCLNPMDKFLNAPTIKIEKLDKLPKEFPTINL